MFELAGFDTPLFGEMAGSASVFIVGATVCYVAGFVLRGQVALRTLVLIGTVFYVLYYATAAETPLWDAIYTSLMIGTATLIGLIRVLMDPIEWLVRPRDRPVFDKMEAMAPGVMQPGQFRRLMRLAKRRRAETDIVVTAPDHYPPELVFVMSGTARVVWGADVELRRHPRFIGEVAFVRGPPGMGKVILEKGADYVAWPMGPLRRALGKNHDLDRALRAVIAQDLAGKMDGYVRRAALLKSGIDPDDAPEPDGGSIIEPEPKDPILDLGTPQHLPFFRPPGAPLPHSAEER